ncbi:MAG: dihydrodipicolinate synthase family protein, partial [Blastopirellula sp. JB062]
QYRLLKLFDAMLYNSEFPEGFRAAIGLRGLQPGKGRQPQSDTQLLAIGELKRELQCLLAAEGFVDEPIGGCAIKEEVDSDEVARIVQNVVGELKRRGFA